jgi:enoyl-[acyl-carrier-protein] reductase (NADH)
MSKEKALERDILNPSEKKSLAEDIADVALFLASEKSNDITGKEIPVDEGFLTSLIKE